MTSDSNCVLRKRGVFIRIWMRSRAAEVLQIIMRDLVRVGAKRRKLKPRFLWLKRERIHLDRVKEILPALLAGEEVIDPGQQRVAAEFPGIAAPFKAERFRRMHAMLARLAGKNVRATHSIENAGDFGQHVAGVAVRLLNIPRKLRAHVIDQAGSESAGQGE